MQPITITLQSIITFEIFKAITVNLQFVYYFYSITLLILLYHQQTLSDLPVVESDQFTVFSLLL